MSLATIMLEQLAAARRIVEYGHEMVPAWRIATAEGTFLILPRLDTENIEQRDRALFLISPFMAWKMAASFVLTAETWLGAEKTRYGDEALLAIGVSHHERLAVLQHIQRGEAVGFGKQQWLHPTRSMPRTSACCRRGRPKSHQKRLPNSRGSSARMEISAPSG